MSAWATSLEGHKVGCFILDPPMELHKGTHGWSLRDIMKTVNVIDQNFTNEFAIILYTVHSMAEVQVALKQEPIADGSRLSVSRFVIAKVNYSWFEVASFISLLPQIMQCVTTAVTSDVMCRILSRQAVVVQAHTLPATWCRMCSSLPPTEPHWTSLWQDNIPSDGLFPRWTKMMWQLGARTYSTYLDLPLMFAHHFD